MQLKGQITSIGDWILVRWSIGKGVKVDIDKRCRACGAMPQPGQLAWMNHKQPYIYCYGCLNVQ